MILWIHSDAAAIRAIFALSLYSLDINFKSLHEFQCFYAF